MTLEQSVPLFPLPNVLLYPGAVLPLHVFEPRYVRLVEDLREQENPLLVLGVLKPDWEDHYFDNPPVHSIGGCGRMVQSQRVGTSRWNILVEGSHRVRIEEEPATGLYRRVRTEFLSEIPIADPTKEALVTDQLRKLLSTLADDEISPGLDRGPSYLTDLLLVAMNLEMEEKIEIFSELDVERRARWVLDQARDVADANRALRALETPYDARWN